MSLQIYNSITKSKSEFQPINGKNVNVYVCGLTVYDLPHLGHARLYVFFDVIVRYLRAMGYNVKYVRNITDIDDKIINKANELNDTSINIAKKYIKEFNDDFAKLNLIPPDIEPQATTHIPQIIEMINKLVASNHAYITTSDDVYFSVADHKDYGELSHRDLEGQEAGIRVEVVEDKKHPEDFVLWKSSKDGEPSWKSPWGDGRPGWHIECSAMSTHYLSDYFDIHGGGYDLLFPHHENELAQSKACSGKDFVKYWMHIGYLQLNKEKMSKSTGNFFTIRELLKTYHPESIRMFLISSHYRSQQNFDEQNIRQADAGLLRLYSAIMGMDEGQLPNSSEYITKFNAAMDDDFNTSVAVSVLFELAHLIEKNKKKDAKKASQYASELKHLASMLGLLEHSCIEFFKFGFSSDAQEIIEAKITQRSLARQEKNWDLADSIRNDLLAMNVEIEDTTDGTIWRRKPN